MNKEKGEYLLPPARLNLEPVRKSLLEVQQHWLEIDDQLDALGIGRKDTPFTSEVREGMEIAFAFVDHLVEIGEKPFAPSNLGMILELNNMVHYRVDMELRKEYGKAIKHNSEKFYARIGAIRDWYKKHEGKGDSPVKLAAKVYIAILARPQLFIEGNHRTGSLVANWILLDHGYPPFVLTRENAIAYFHPSSQIKKFVDHASWRGKLQLPEWHKRYGKFLEENIDEKFMA